MLSACDSPSTPTDSIGLPQGIPEARKCTQDRQVHQSHYRKVNVNVN